MKAFAKIVAIFVSFLFALNVYAVDAYQSCVSCHGDQGQGSETAPRLKGQYDWYIITSLEKFKSGERPNANGRVHTSLSETDMKSVAEYLAKLK